MKRRSFYWVAFMFLTFAIALPLRGVAQTSGADGVRQQLRKAASTFRSYQLRESHDPYIAPFDTNTYREVTYELRGGEDYVFLGVCDDNCSGVHLQLFDAYGQVVEGVEQDGLALVVATIATGGNFRVRLTMRRCYTDYCYAGIGAYR